MSSAAQEDFRRLDKDGNGILDVAEVEILDVATWDTDTAKAQTPVLNATV